MTRTRLSSAPAFPAWSPRSNSPMPAKAWSSFSIRRANRALGGQAFWSFGGLFLVEFARAASDRHPQFLRTGSRRLDADGGFRSSEEDFWPRKWAEAYVAFAAGEKRSWLSKRDSLVSGCRLGGTRRHNASGQGNSVPRFHVTWGTGPGLIAPLPAVQEGEKRGLVFQVPPSRQRTVQRRRRLRRKPDILEPSNVARGHKSSRTKSALSSLGPRAVIVCSGGIAGIHALVRKNWPPAMGPAPPRLHAAEACPISSTDGYQRHRRGRRRRRSSITTGCGATPTGLQKLESDLDQPRRTLSIRSFLPVARRNRQALPAAAVSRIRQPRPRLEAHYEDRLRS